MSDRPKRILVIDDDEELLEAFHVALKQRGFDVLLARNGAEGLSRVERDAPDLIVLDLVMPKRSGFAVLHHLRRSGLRRPRVIMLTASDEPRHREVAAAHAVDAFIRKPFDMKTLFERIDELLGSD